MPQLKLWPGNITRLQKMFLGRPDVISAEKSDEFSDISQQKLYLGFIMCSVSMTAKVSDEKMSSVISFIQTHISHERISVKDLAKIAGRIAALRPALGFLFFSSLALHTLSLNSTLIIMVGLES